MTFTTYLIADISTRYITAKDGKLISFENAPGRLAAIDPPDASSGSIFTTPSNANWLNDRVGEYREHGFSPAFIAIMTELSRQGIPYVRFDADGAEVEGAPMFEW